MEKEGQSDQISCPQCNRDYDLPRRYLIHLNDYDFSPIPRLLPCLHSMCHSCLEEQFEKNNNQFIECVLCRHKEIVKGINFLPLDLTILKQVVNTNSTELLATCARCYDVVPSISWCESCSSALCEFHHQDHKLSVETSKHNFHTFKEYFYQNRHIQYRFPPVSCPECAMQDCEYYCLTCYHLISPKGFIDFHKTHEIKAIDEIFPDMSRAVKQSIAKSKKSIDELQLKIQKIKEYLNALDENEENNLLLIHKQFNLIYSHLKQREKALTNNFTTAIDVERKKLLSQLSNMVELVEDYQQVVRTGGNFLSFSQQPNQTMNLSIPQSMDVSLRLQQQQQQSQQQTQAPPPPVPLLSSQQTLVQQSPLKKNRSINAATSSFSISSQVYNNSSDLEKCEKFNEPMYLIAATDSIEDRCDYLNNQLKEKLDHFNSQIIPIYSLEFNHQDLNMIHGTINCLGAMNEFPYLSESEEMLKLRAEQEELEKQTKEELEGNNNNNDPWSKLEENYGSMHFSINVG
jgi:hypothetical protein